MFVEAKGLEKINSFFLCRSVWSQGSPGWQIQISHFTWQPPMSHKVGPNPQFLVHGVLVWGKGLLRGSLPVPSRAWNQVMIPVIEKWCKVTGPETYIRLLVWNGLELVVGLKHYIGHFDGHAFLFQSGVIRSWNQVDLVVVYGEVHGIGQNTSTISSHIMTWLVVENPLGGCYV